mmetsp:Transcript_107880/g.315381  ORF Transcript_107880/g.315381 Transcript_107880/m.315381 type:complete len:358 (-) Transcript_107880:220-1293(-)
MRHAEVLSSLLLQEAPDAANLQPVHVGSPLLEAAGPVSQQRRPSHDLGVLVGRLVYPGDGEVAVGAPRGLRPRVPHPAGSLPEGAGQVGAGGAVLAHEEHEQGGGRICHCLHKVPAGQLPDAVLHNGSRARGGGHVVPRPRAGVVRIEERLDPLRRHSLQAVLRIHGLVRVLLEPLRAGLLHEQELVVRPDAGDLGELLRVLGLGEEGELQLRMPRRVRLQRPREVLSLRGGDQDHAEARPGQVLLCREAVLRLVHEGVRVLQQPSLDGAPRPLAAVGHGLVAVAVDRERGLALREARAEGQQELELLVLRQALEQLVPLRPPAHHCDGHGVPGLHGLLREGGHVAALGDLQKSLWR